MKLLKSCCCCCSLQTGTIIIALVELLPLIFSLGYIIKVLVESDPKTNTDRERETENLAQISSNLEFGKQILKLVLCIISVNIIRCLLLILGSCKKKSWMFLPWLGIQLNGLIGTPVFVIYILSEVHLFPEILYGVTIVILILTAINSYFFHVVVSRFEEIRSKQACLEIKDQEKV